MLFSSIFLLPTAESSTADMDVDEALLSIGCGRFQIMTQIILTYVAITTGYQTTMSYFVGDDAPWTCNNVTTTTYNNNITTSFCQQHR